MMSSPSKENSKKILDVKQIQEDLRTIVNRSQLSQKRFYKDKRKRDWHFLQKIILVNLIQTSRAIHGRNFHEISLIFPRQFQYLQIHSATSQVKFIRNKNSNSIFQYFGTSVRTFTFNGN